MKHVVWPKNKLFLFVGFLGERVACVSSSPLQFGQWAKKSVTHIALLTCDPSLGYNSLGTMSVNWRSQLLNVPYHCKQKHSLLWRASLVTNERKVFHYFRPLFEGKGGLKDLQKKQICSGLMEWYWDLVISQHSLGLCWEVMKELCPWLSRFVQTCPHLWWLDSILDVGDEGIY